MPLYQNESKCETIHGNGEKRGKREKNEGGLRLLAIVLPRFFLARFCSSPTTESLEQATLRLASKQRHKGTRKCPKRTEKNMAKDSVLF